MNRKNKRLMALILAAEMLLTGCSTKLEDMFVTKQKNPFRDLPSSQTDPSKESDSSSTETLLPTEETILITDEQTEPVVETLPPTEESVIETEPVIEIEPVIETEPPVIETLPPSEENNSVNENIIDDNLVYATTNVNMRSSNTAQSLKIGELKVGEAAFRIFSCENNWDLVRYNGEIAYVCRDYLKYSNEQQEDGYVHTPIKDIVLTTTDVNFRSTPSTEKERIGIFPKNTELEVIAEVDNGWLLVKYNGVIGYVHGDYTISLLEKVQEQYPDLNITELDFQKIVFSTTTLNMRNGNSTDYGVINELERYESARVIIECDDWYFVMTNEYEFGFISKNYTKDLNDIFVIVDISQQKLYLYHNNELYYITPVTTGKDSTPTNIGEFSVLGRYRYATLMNDSKVDYWMPINSDGEGLHDAQWRYIFGTQDYHTIGSHGCINMPLDITDDIYNTVEVGTKVLVHK